MNLKRLTLTALLLGTVSSLSCIVLADDTASGILSKEDAKKLKSPVPNSKKSISQGRVLFARASCVSCHGADAKAQVDVVANATDLTDPRGYRDGETEGEMFRSIQEGAGDGMPSFKGNISSDDTWNLVNFIRSLWPESVRPPVVEDK